MGYLSGPLILCLRKKTERTKRGDKEESNGQIIHLFLTFH